MKLNWKNAFEAILRFGNAPDESAALPVSMVLLHRKSRFFSLDELRSAAERAFGAPYGGGKESRYCVFQAGFFTLMNAGSHTLSFMNYTKPYGEGEFSEEFGKSLPNARQRQAWAEHTGWWTAVDYVKGGVDRELKYCILAKLCAEMLDANCMGVYVPGKN